MASAVFFPAVFVAICVGYLCYRRRAAAKAMDRAVQMVKLGLFGRLRHLYSSEMEGIEATLLAGAVTDYIFSEEPAGLRAWRYRAENLDRIQSEAKRLPADISELVSQAVIAQTSAVHPLTRQQLRLTTSRLQRLTDLGIRPSEIENPVPDRFIPAALSLYRASNGLTPDSPERDDQAPSRSA
jgi:hypothetical protein